jgi:dihydrofolate reductase
LGKIHFYFATSLDGYIADPRGGVGFLDEFHDEESTIETFIRDIGTLVMGRGTYRFLEEYGSWPYGTRFRTIVLTHHQIEKPLCALETRVVDDVSAFASELRRYTDGDVWIIGGGVVMGAFLAAGQVDRVEMSIVPVAIGRGIPTYSQPTETLQRFNLVEIGRTPKGVVRLVYQHL